MNEDKNTEIMELARELCGEGEQHQDCFHCPTLRCCGVQKFARELYGKGWCKQKWISVDERLPEKDGMYLIFSPYTNKEGGIVYCNRFLTKGNPIFPPNSFESIIKVTHWMPLPEAPKMEGNT